MLAFTSALVPTLTIVPPAIATASAIESAASTVMIRPLMSARSARAGGDGRWVDASVIPQPRIAAVQSRRVLAMSSQLSALSSQLSAFNQQSAIS
jgi:hypothetical protein